jgi:hypothetical protein
MNRFSNIMADDKPTGTAEPPNAEPRSHQFRGVVISLCWLANVIILLAVIGWIVVDVRAGNLLSRQWTQMLPRWRTILADHEIIVGINRRISWLAVLRVGAIFSAAGILAGLIWGAPRQRRIAAWLAATALAAVWLAALTSTSELTWMGQRWRLAQKAPKLEPIAAELQNQWPAGDGATDSLGPFSLYSTKSASVLVPLTSKTTIVGIPLVTIERSPHGALRFQTVDQSQHPWLEWHPEGSEPASFVGGLEAYHELNRSSPLGNGWYATKYVVRRSDEATYLDSN